MESGTPSCEYRAPDDLRHAAHLREHVDRRGRVAVRALSAHGNLAGDARQDLRTHASGRARPCEVRAERLRIVYVVGGWRSAMSDGGSAPPKPILPSRDTVRPTKPTTALFPNLSPPDVDSAVSDPGSTTTYRSSIATGTTVLPAKRFPPKLKELITVSLIRLGTEWALRRGGRRLRCLNRAASSRGAEIRTRDL
jgi:hypothetical protein